MPLNSLIIRCVPRVITVQQVNDTVSLYNLFVKKFGFVITPTPFNLVWLLAGGSYSTYRGNWYILCQTFLYVIENYKGVNTVNIILCIFQQIVTEAKRPY